jgi:hypothetical protein
LREFEQLASFPGPAARRGQGTARTGVNQSSGILAQKTRTIQPACSSSRSHQDQPRHVATCAITSTARATSMGQDARQKLPPHAAAMRRRRPHESDRPVEQEGAGVAPSAGGADGVAAAASGLAARGGRGADRQAERIEMHLNQQTEHSPAVLLLRSIPGVGVRTAEAVATIIDDPDRFRDAGPGQGVAPGRHPVGMSSESYRSRR